MDYKLTTLPSGLRVLTVEMPSLESLTVTIWVKTGSRNEEKRINGISHFLEHMVFKGSSKRKTAKEISQVVDSIGGEFNAGTSKDWTNFYIKCRAASLDTAMDVLTDMVFKPILDPEEIEREKGTIVEEIRMYEDTPMYRIGDVFEQLAFKGNPLGWDIAGDEESVRSVTRADFDKYRGVRYFPENILITVSGGIKESEALPVIKKYLEPVTPNKIDQTLSEEFKIEQKSPKFLLHSKKKEQAHMILGFLGEGRGYKSRFAQSLMSVILGGGMSSRLFIEVRERRGLAYAIRTSMERYDDVGYIGTYAGVDTTKADEAVKVILEQCYGLASGKYPIEKEELSKAKEYIKGHMALSLEDTKDVGSFFAEQALFLKHILTPEEIYRKIDEVSIEDILKEAKKLFVPERLNLAIIGPYDNGKKFEDIIKI
jgi:predicted Zn-dependent peptidase